LAYPPFGRLPLPQPVAALPDFGRNCRRAAAPTARLLPIACRFAASPNVANLTIGDITGIDNKGWEYPWGRYADGKEIVAKVLVKKSIAVYVEHVYLYGDLSLMGIDR
jgi:hypothetical protein